MESSQRNRQRGGGILREVDLALEVPRWAGRFYLRHFVVVAGISALPAAQRAVSQLWASSIPAPLALAGEIATGVARVILLVVVFRLAVMSEERLRPVAGWEAMRRVRRFARDHWGSLVVQLVLIGVMVIVFDRLPDAVIAPRIPEPAQRGYWAVLLAVKNPTIIAFTLIWDVGILRQMLLHGYAARTGEAVLERNQTLREAAAER